MPCQQKAHLITFNVVDPFNHTLIPLDSWVTEGIDWVVLHFRPIFQGIRVPVDLVLGGFENFLTSMPAPVAIIFITDCMATFR